MIRIVIHGEPRTKKNSSRIVKVGKFSKLIPSKAYCDYEKDFIWQCKLLKAHILNIDYKCNIKCVYYMKTKRKVDLTNLLGGTMDCLVSAGVIKDDNCNIAYSHNGSYVDYDKNNPRVEIEIERIQEYD